MTTTNEKLAKLEAIKAANRKLVAEKAEIARIDSQIELEGKATLLDSRTALVNKQYTNNVLREAIETAEEIINSNPLINKKTKDYRIWNPKYLFSYGDQVNLAYQLCSGIIFSAKEHRDIILAKLGLSLEILNEVFEGFGSPAYYNRKSHMYIDAVSFDIDRVQAGLDMLMSELGVNIYKGKITKKEMEYQFMRGEVEAKTMAKKAEEAREAGVDMDDL